MKKTYDVLSFYKTNLSFSQMPQYLKQLVALVEDSSPFFSNHMMVFNDFNYIFRGTDFYSDL